MELRDYQKVTLEKVREIVRSGVKRLVVQMPTGSGKTRLAAEIVNAALEKKKRVTFAVANISLVDQTVEKFYQEGIKQVGVIQQSHMRTDAAMPVQVASIQTLSRRPSIPTCDLVIRDECHKLFKFDLTWMYLPSWDKVPFIGLSATPWTTGLGRYYKELIIGATTSELIDKGWLCPFKVYAPPVKPDLRKITVVGGDYQIDQLSKEMSREPLTADAVETWKKHAQGRPTVCFAVDCAHAEALSQKFRDAGIPSRCIDYRTSLNQRAAFRKEFESGEIKVIVNVDVIGVGIDWPDISCISYCRPTRSRIRYVQNVGRGLRTHPGKENLLVLDHSDTTLRLGFVTDIIVRKLSLGKREASERRVPLPKPCIKCGILRPANVRVCPSCGFEHKSVPKVSMISHKEGELQEYTELPAYKGPKENFSEADKLVFLAELKGYATEKGWNVYWAAHAYESKFGHRPQGGAFNVPPIPPSERMRTWIKHYHIKRARAREKMEKRNGRVEPTQKSTNVRAPGQERAVSFEPNSLGSRWETR